MTDTHQGIVISHHKPLSTCPGWNYTRGWLPGEDYVEFEHPTQHGYVVHGTFKTDEGHLAEMLEEELERRGKR